MIFTAPFDHVWAAQQPMDDVTAKDGFLLFWGGWPSQWFPCRFTIDGIMYNCAEQFMMASKARLFQDKDTALRILCSPYPKAQKELGRIVRGYDETVWLKHAQAVVFRGNVAKFSQNASLRQRLVETQHDTIVEASPVDLRWGIGLSESGPNATLPDKWRGSNWLGNILMDVRAAL